MGIFQSIILGIVQGVGEFLPISSSAHLILIPYLLNWQEHSLAFDVALHFGTLIAVLVVFFKEWWNLVLATIPGALIGKLFEDKIEDIFRDPKFIYIIAILLAVMGVLIYIGDRYAAKKYKGKETEYENLTLKQTFIIGLSQALAVIPGFSRSGTTILTARLMGVSREAAAKFTFMLSVPIIFGATLLKLPDLITGFSASLIVGIVTAAIVGILSIKFLLRYIKKNDFAIFAYYRVIIAIIILVKFFVF